MKYLTIVCPGHSGSTLLAMCLNCHDRIYTFGEFVSLNRRLHKAKRDPCQGICSFCYGECDFLDKDEQRILRRFYSSKFQKVAKVKSSICHPLYVSRLRRAMEFQILCDSSKSAAWAWKMWRYYNWLIDQKIVVLVRDPRAIVGSHVRKGRDIGTACVKYKATMETIIQFKQSVIGKGRDDQWLDLKYEDLVTAPDKSLKRICNFLEIEWDEAERVNLFPTLSRIFLYSNVGQTSADRS